MLEIILVKGEHTGMKYFTYCYNTKPSTTHNYCPFDLVFGKDPNIYEFLDANTVDPLYNVDAYEKEVKYQLQTANKTAQ